MKKSIKPFRKLKNIPVNSKKPTMTNHFTTPEFSDLLKRHGIEVDTQFYWENNGNGLRLMAIASDSAYIICIGEFDPTPHASFVCKPAYLLSQVLGWLPERFMWKGMDCKFHFAYSKGLLYVGHSGTNKDGSHKYATSCMPIETLIIQGLSEGWLTKEIIEQAIKDNQ